MDTQRILIDTSIAVEGGEAIIAKLEKIAPIFVTDIVLQELDGHKNNANGAVAFQAREFFRKLGNSNGIALDVLPLDGMKLEKTDTLRKMFLGATPLHVIVRKPYKSRDINDSKIIEIAKDYNITLVTLDMAQRVRAMSEGVNVKVLKVKEGKKVNFLSNKFGFLAGIIMIVLSAIGFIALFSAYYFNLLNSKNPIPFIVIGLTMVSAITLSNFFYKAKKEVLSANENHNDSILPITGFDTVNDTVYSSIDGNIYHSGN